MSQHLHEGVQPLGETQTYPEERAEAFKQGLKEFYDIPFQQEFISYCADRGVGIDDVEKPSYWTAVAVYASGISDKARSNGKPERNALTAELLAATPDFIYNNAYLNYQGHDYDDPKVRRNIHQAKASASYYNGLLRDTAQAWPGIKASELSASLLGIANISIENKHIKNSATYTINSAVRGAQHELAFGQILEKTGRHIRSASTKEDLHGVDYVVTDERGNSTYIDVKASLRQVSERDKRHAAPFRRTQDGHLVMYSMVSEEDLNDGFSIPDDVAKQKGEYVETLLQDAQHHHGRRHA